MQIKMTEEKKLKLEREIDSVISAPLFKNTEKLKMIENIILRVTAEQKIAYKQLAKETKIPLAKIVRNSLNTIIRSRPKKPLTPQEQKDNFTNFQKELGLIK